ncbi:MAG: AMP-binding protein, partial [Nitrospinaceae bacterium]|nr:AMP-binding protein [Nitrospinaceae bacterium]
MEPKCHNIAVSLENAARDFPNRRAIVVPHTSVSISFAELNDESSRIASGLNQYGLKKGDRVLLLVPFGIDFISIAFALFKAGTVPILIDPGLGRKNVLQCVEESQPKGMVAIPLAHSISRVFRKPFQSVRQRITVGSR